MKDARYYAFYILKEYHRSNKRLKTVRDQYFKKTRLSQTDILRSFVLTNEIVRWQARLDYWISLFLDKPIKKLNPSVNIILRLGFYESIMDDSIPSYAAVHSWVELAKTELGKKLSGLVNALMRKTNEIDPIHRDDNQSISEWYSFPDWLIEQWIDHFGNKKAFQLCEYFNEQSSTDFRLNWISKSKENILRDLEKLKIEIVNSPESNNFIRVKSGAQYIFKSDLFERGLVIVQDRASGAVVELLDPQAGETIIDCCAAPGTKSSYIIEKMKFKGNVYASDLSKKRGKLGKETAKRFNIPIQWEYKDASADEFPMADRILIDAPCTGTGVIGRRPDIRWRRKKNDAKSMANIQTEILGHMAQFLKPNGILIYATCSLELEENWNVVESFLKLNNNFTLESGKNFVPSSWLNDQGCLETFPPRDKVDGMFAARIRKK